jgi:hypothetical protein
MWKLRAVWVPFWFPKNLKWFMVRALDACAGKAARSPPARGRINPNYEFYNDTAMGIEEQKEEREILESIYPDEITGSYPFTSSYTP